MTLAEALGMTADEVVALVGGGGKTTAMFRLAREMVDTGGSAITTTTTRIFGAQIALAPAHVGSGATRESVSAALSAHRHVLVIGDTNPKDGKAEGVSLDLFQRLRGWFPGVCLLNEADGSRMRPFKAPAAHEPVVPVETTLVVPLVGADVFGKTLDAASVHRPELISALSGAPLGTPITPEIVARVLAHPEGGRKSVPPGARVVVLINKAEILSDRKPAHETAERLLREPAIASVVLTALRAESPVLEICKR